METTEATTGEKVVFVLILVLMFVLPVLLFFVLLVIFTKTSEFYPEKDRTHSEKEKIIFFVD